MPQPPFITIAPSAARTITGNGDSIDLTSYLDNGRFSNPFPPQLVVQSDVTAITGTATPTVTVTIQDSIDGGANWNSIGVFTAQTTTNRLVIAIGLRGDAYPASFRWPFNPRRVRASWVISGTNPSLTFSVKAVVV